ncbi:hypothetical protein [Chryseobacterium phocaeense]|uniref:hypothetical protein n=1 Tax=Chryseobacterium phocaeense TaxID=1816690 RepID=UPI0009B98289|nr:hypothetical protein [Chryseobacterium phocaeense]
MKLESLKSEKFEVLNKKQMQRVFGGDCTRDGVWANGMQYASDEVSISDKKIYLYDVNGKCIFEGTYKQ